MTSVHAKVSSPDDIYSVREAMTDSSAGKDPEHFLTLTDLLQNLASLNSVAIIFCRYTTQAWEHWCHINGYPLETVSSLTLH